MSHTLKPEPDALSGLLVLDKPYGQTSMSMVVFTRHRAGRRKTGHAGTLDPLATGVLLLAVGKATKSIPRLMDTTKRYRTEIDLSAFSPSDDLESEPVPVEGMTPPSESAIRAALDAQFVGAHMQRPPLFSALMIDGKRAYKHARRGDDVTVPPRPALTFSIDIAAYEFPRLTLDVHCAKGFYIRSLARELGGALGTGGYCVSIRRTAVGPFSVDKAHTPESIGDAVTADHLIDIDAMLAAIESETDIT